MMRDLPSGSRMPPSMRELGSISLAIISDCLAARSLLYQLFRPRWRWACLMAYGWIRNHRGVTEFRRNKEGATSRAQYCSILRWCFFTARRWPSACLPGRFDFYAHHHASMACRRRRSSGHHAAHMKARGGSCTPGGHGPRFCATA